MNGRHHDLRSKEKGPITFVAAALHYFERPQKKDLTAFAIIFDFCEDGILISLVTLMIEKASAP